MRGRCIVLRARVTWPFRRPTASQPAPPRARAMSSSARMRCTQSARDRSARTPATPSPRCPPFERRLDQGRPRTRGGALRARPHHPSSAATASSRSTAAQHYLDGGPVWLRWRVLARHNRPSKVSKLAIVQKVEWWKVRIRTAVASGCNQIQSAFDRFPVEERLLDLPPQDHETRLFKAVEDVHQASL